MISRSGLPEPVKNQATQVFTELAIAESRVHGTTLENVHFHEVGAIDSIIDTCGVLVALHLLGVTQVMCSEVPMSSGTVWTAHGHLPVPAPATMSLLQGFKLCPGPKSATGELVTPTGASLLRVLCRFPSLQDTSEARLHPVNETSQGKLPPSGFCVHAVGVGAGTKDFEKHPNILRVLLGYQDDSASPPEPHSLWEEKDLFLVQANIDDQSAEVMAYSTEKIMSSGHALDCWLESILMKKGRAAVQLNALCEPQQKDALLTMIFTETSTIGIRIIPVQRASLRRVQCKVDTGFGHVTAKASFLGNECVTLKPEYEECRRLAEDYRVPLKQVIAGATSLVQEEEER